ncbi:MAG: hypothetical protein ABSF90_09095 [Syntrophobacteraceae bacterium]
MKFDLQKKFFSADVARKVCIESGKLARWADMGIVKPTGATRGGSGTRNEYGVEDIVRIGLMKALADEDHSMRLASSLAFESAQESEYGRVLDEAIRKCISAWVDYVSGGMKSRFTAWMGHDPRPEDAPVLEDLSRPNPAYFVFFHEKTSGKLACLYIQDQSNFTHLYQRLNDIKAPRLINLTAIVHEVLSGLVQE